MKKSFARRYLLNIYSIIGIVLILIISGFVFASRNKKPVFESTIAVIGDVIEKVDVTGKILPVEKADLGFEKGGKVVAINFKVGDKVKKGDLIASLDTATDLANLKSAQAKLADLSRGLNQPELALAQSKINIAKVALDNAKQDALNAARSALALTEGAVNNHADTLFENPQSPNPTISIRTPSYSDQLDINRKRVQVSEILKEWRSNIEKYSVEDVTRLISTVDSYEVTVKVFMDHLSRIVGDLSTGNSGLSRTDIDSYISSINSGQSALNQAINSITGAKTALENAVSNYDQAYNDFLLKNSGSSAQAILAQSSVVDAYKAELEKNKIISPIDGIVTRVELNIGEFVSPGTVVFNVISDGNYKIEAYVPEADIAKVSIGDLASTTLDAYGQSVDFPTVVNSIDPAETILEGVPTYKVVLKFLYEDERIRSGMTANLEIITNKKTGVIIVPSRAIITSNREKIVRIVDPKGKNFFDYNVSVGLKGSDGVSEIISGVNVGDRVVTYIK